MGEIILRNKNIDDEGIKAVAKALKRCKNLTLLCLSGNNIGDEGANTLAKALEGCKDLTQLYLSGNKIGDEGITAIAKALEGCKSLTTMYLKDNNVGTDGAKALAKTLEGCRNLTNLNLHNNKIGDEGVKAVAKTLKGCPNLTTLCLRENNIGTEGIKAVAKALEGCRNLKDVFLSHSNIGKEGYKAIAKSLHKACSSVRIDFYDDFWWSPSRYSHQVYLPKELFSRVCSPEDDIDVSDANSCVASDTAVEPPAKPKIHEPPTLSCSTVVEYSAKPKIRAPSKLCSNALILALMCASILSMIFMCKFYDKVWLLPSQYSFWLFTPEELFARIYFFIEDMYFSDNNSSISRDPACEPLAKPKNDALPRLSLNVLSVALTSAIALSLARLIHFLSTLILKASFAKVVLLPGKQGEVETVKYATEAYASEEYRGRPSHTSVGFTKVVQLAQEVSASRADRGGARGDSLQTGITLLEEFVGPVIQSYFGHVKLRKLFDDVKKSKQNLDAFQDQIRKDPRHGVLSLIEKRNDERDRLRSLVQDVYTWVHPNHYQSDAYVAHEYKVKLTSLLQTLNLSNLSVVQQARVDDLIHCQQLVSQATTCIEKYKMNGEARPNNIGDRSQCAVESVMSRANELNLGDLSWVILRQPEKALKLEPELLELESALQEELEALRGDTLSAEISEILTAISLAFHRLDGHAERAALRNASRLSPEYLSEIYDYALLGSKEPNISDVEALYERLCKSRKATESLKRAKQDLEAEDLEDEERVHYRSRIEKQKRILSQGSPIELSKVFRHKLARTLQHAQEHYPELLQDKTWLERLHISAEGLFEVACSDLWLANVQAPDFQFVGDLLASRGGKTVQKVLDGNGKTLVLKQFQLGHPSLSKMFYKQVANLGKVTSQHVIRIIGAFVDLTHGVPRGCIVMPFYEQGNLAQWIENHPRGDKAVRDRLAMGLLIGVADLHTHGIVHCDIKPENIFLTSNGTPLIGDCDGIKVADCTATYTSVQATPRYIAPELKNGPIDKFETAVDMYSVGVVLEDLYPTERTTAMQELIATLKATDPDQRLSAREVLQHDAFGIPDAPLKGCLVCMEEHPLSDGTSCERGHFICRDCIARSVEAAAQPQASVTIANDGTMSCVEPGCDGGFTGQEMTRLAPRALNHLLLIAKTRAESEASARAEQEIQRRIAEALQVDGLTRDVRRHLLHIQENVLNTCCPNCHSCFDQFDACCAVKCGSDTCGHHFCAWCLEYSSESNRACHDHVRNCPRKLTRNAYFADSFEQVRQGWRILRAERLREYWNENIQDRNLRRALGQQLEPLLTPDIVDPGFRL